MKPPTGQSTHTSIATFSTAIRLSPALIDHIDRERDIAGLSRAAFIRQLIVDDIRRQGRATKRTSQA